MKRISILGSTGSVGQNALRVIEKFPERLMVVGLGAGKNVDLLAKQIKQFRPEVVSVSDSASAARLRNKLEAVGMHRLMPKVSYGKKGMSEVATNPLANMVLCATVGVVGLEACYAAILASKDLALANKEVLVAAGELMMKAAKTSGSKFIPVDSEHSAIHQCLRAGHYSEVRRLILTASGGPFLRTPKRRLNRVTSREALNHPTWRMGERITIDSATLMNKGFEVIEAHWLFGLGADQIEVMIHPQSIVHSMVEFVDGSVLAQLGVTDMRQPIQYAFSYPERWNSTQQFLNMAEVGKLEFEKPDFKKFPCLQLAYDALAMGGGAPCALNAADEVVVDAFLAGKIRFSRIASIIEKAVAKFSGFTAGTMEELIGLDGEVRTFTSWLLAQ